MTQTIKLLTILGLSFLPLHQAAAEALENKHEHHEMHNHHEAHEHAHEHHDAHQHDSHSHAHHARANTGSQPALPAQQKAGQLWTCGMHPHVIQDKPGDCPICHMKLTPFDPAHTATGAGETLRIEPEIVQNMGVREAPVREGKLTRTVRAVGYLREADPKRKDINLLVSGWIRKLYAHSAGMGIEEGQPLFDLYSPDLSVAIDELIAAKGGREKNASPSLRALYQAARKKLSLWGLDQKQIDSLERSPQAPELVTFYSPVSGFLAETAVVEGAAVEAGSRVMRIVDYSTLWLTAEIYEQDLPFVRLGEHVEATLAGTERVISGEVFFLHPQIKPETRTAEARITVENEDLALHPGMYAEVRLQTVLDNPSLLVPSEAVIDTGVRKTAFVSLGDGTFAIREIETGPAGDDGLISIRSGLHEGEHVVVSGQFLLDAESRFREAARKFVSQEHAGHHHH